MGRIEHPDLRGKVLQESAAMFLLLERPGAKALRRIDDSRR